MTYRIPARRSGFTLIELMVAAALSLVIMTIMALAFQSAMSTLSTLKSLGDQADRLRTAEVMLRADLDAEHIVGDDGGAIKVSDLRFDQGTQTFKNGYFKIDTAKPFMTTTTVSEGIDSDGIQSTRMNAPGDNALTMTVRRTSRTTSDLFGGPDNGIGRVSDTLGDPGVSQWAEVKWQLGTPNTINGVQMFPLHRIVKAVGNPVKTPSAMTTAAGTSLGDDIVLTNVVSFEVKPLLFNRDGQTVSAGIDTPYSDTSWNTASTTAPTTRCVAVLIKVRLYDIKTKLTRQMSLIVKI